MMRKYAIASVLLIFVVISGCGGVISQDSHSGKIFVENDDTTEYRLEIIVTDTDGSIINSTSVTVPGDRKKQLQLIPETGEYHIRVDIEGASGQNEITREVDGSAIMVDISDGEVDLTEGGG